MITVPMLAYIDPGAGSLALQFMLASVLGLSFYFRKAVRSVASRIFGRKSGDHDDETADTPSEGQDGK